MSRSIDNMMADFEFMCLRMKNGLMSRFFYETCEFKLHSKAKKLFKHLNYLNKKIDRLKKAPHLYTENIDKLIITKKCVEAKIEDVQYHNVSHHAARTLYESYDFENGYWS